jgi:hypothetical protein
MRGGRASDRSNDGPIHPWPGRSANAAASVESYTVGKQKRWTLAAGPCHHQTRDSGGSNFFRSPSDLAIRRQFTVSPVTALSARLLRVASTGARRERCARLPRSRGAPRALRAAPCTTGTILPWLLPCLRPHASHSDARASSMLACPPDHLVLCPADRSLPGAVAAAAVSVDPLLVRCRRIRRSHLNLLSHRTESFVCLFESVFCLFRLNADTYMTAERMDVPAI